MTHDTAQAIADAPEAVQRVTITLPHPPASLSPNGRAHWSERNRDAQKWRTIARALTLAEMELKPYPSWEPLRPWLAATMRITWRFAGRQPDDDNVIARMKPVRDGIADAGLVSDDGLIRVEGVTFERVPRAEQAVVVTVSKGA